MIPAWTCRTGPLSLALAVAREPRPKVGSTSRQALGVCTGQGVIQVAIGPYSAPEIPGKSGANTLGHVVLGTYPCLLHAPGCPCSHRRTTHNPRLGRAGGCASFLPRPKPAYCTKLVPRSRKSGHCSFSSFSVPCPHAPPCSTKYWMELWTCWTRGGGVEHPSVHLHPLCQPIQCTCTQTTACKLPVGDVLALCGRPLHASSHHSSHRPHACLRSCKDKASNLRKVVGVLEFDGWMTQALTNGRPSI